mmetsp:Transcript_27981/g.78428  ORF Transcript_27981/g.78428 Transcript_27981/m.78428 type:complete len:373 (-) Transcript_27981:1045-2163(-)
MCQIRCRLHLRPQQEQRQPSTSLHNLVPPQIKWRRPCQSSNGNCQRTAPRCQPRRRPKVRSREMRNMEEQSQPSCRSRRRRHRNLQPQLRNPWTPACAGSAPCDQSSPDTTVLVPQVEKAHLQDPRTALPRIAGWAGSSDPNAPCGARRKVSTKCERRAPPDPPLVLPRRQPSIPPDCPQQMPRRWDSCAGKAECHRNRRLPLDLGSSGGRCRQAANKREIPPANLLAVAVVAAAAAPQWPRPHRPLSLPVLATAAAARKTRRSCFPCQAFEKHSPFQRERSLHRHHHRHYHQQQRLPLEQATTPRWASQQQLLALQQQHQQQQQQQQQLNNLVRPDLKTGSNQVLESTDRSIRASNTLRPPCRPCPPIDLN